MRMDKYKEEDTTREYTYWVVAVDCRVKSWKEADYNYKLRSKIVEDVKRHHKFLEVPEREGN
jgi:hypothetical protein